MDESRLIELQALCDSTKRYNDGARMMSLREEKISLSPEEFQSLLNLVKTRSND